MLRISVVRFLLPPVELEVTFMNSGMAENALLMPGSEIVSPNAVKYMAKDVIEAFKVFYFDNFGCKIINLDNLLTLISNKILDSQNCL